MIIQEICNRLFRKHTWIEERLKEKYLIRLKNNLARDIITRRLYDEIQNTEIIELLGFRPTYTNLKRIQEGTMKDDARVVEKYELSNIVNTIDRTFKYVKIIVSHIEIIRENENEDYCCWKVIMSAVMPDKSTLMHEIDMQTKNQEDGTCIITHIREKLPTEKSV